MKLEVGMYVRTINGKIWIITSQKAISGHRKDIIKASYNIIDLIEVGDYVNGYPIYEIVEYEDDTRAIVIGDDNKSIIWKKQDVKSVITHEQMEQMTYKVGE